MKKFFVRLIPIDYLVTIEYLVIFHCAINYNINDNINKRSLNTSACQVFSIRHYLITCFSKMLDNKYRYRTAESIISKRIT